MAVNGLCVPMCLQAIIHSFIHSYMGIHMLRTVTVIYCIFASEGTKLTTFPLSSRYTSQYENLGKQTEQTI